MDKNKDIRNSLNKMRNIRKGENFYEKPLNESIPLDMREMLKRARKLNEADGDLLTTNLPELDKKKEKERLENTFKEINPVPNVYIEDFFQIDDRDGNAAGFFLSGGIGGILTFVITVGKTEDVSDLKIEPMEGMDAENPNNERIMELLEAYYEEFKENWIKSIDSDEQI